VVEEGFVFFVLEVRFDGGGEEGEVFFVEEEVEFVAGVFGVFLTL
jgi:hypothetical protein